MIHIFMHQKIVVTREMGTNLEYFILNLSYIYISCFITRNLAKFFLSRHANRLQQ